MISNLKSIFFQWVGSTTNFPSTQHFTAPTIETKVYLALRAEKSRDIHELSQLRRGALEVGTPFQQPLDMPRAARWNNPRESHVVYSGYDSIHN